MRKIILLSLLLSISSIPLLVSCGTTKETVAETTEPTPPLHPPNKPVDNRNFIEQDDDRDVLKHGETRKR